MVTLRDIVHNKEAGRKKVNAFISGCTIGSYSCHPAFEDSIFIRSANVFLS